MGSVRFSQRLAAGYDAAAERAVESLHHPLRQADVMEGVAARESDVFRSLVDAANAYGAGTARRLSHVVVEQGRRVVQLALLREDAHHAVDLHPHDVAHDYAVLDVGIVPARALFSI